MIGCSRGEREVVEARGREAAYAEASSDETGRELLVTGGGEKGKERTRMGRQGPLPHSMLILDKECILISWRYKLHPASATTQ